VSKQRDYKLEEYEKDFASQLDESITIREQIVCRRKRVHNRE
jgi:hypothetical protein